MSITTVETGNVPIKMWLPENECEPQALEQLKKIASLPWVFRHVAAMPDCHLGKGATVGSVVAMKNAVAPAAVGVDIGCGMGAILTSLTADDLPDNLRNLRLDIESAIPVGRESHSPSNIRHNRQMNRERVIELFEGYSSLRGPVQDIQEKARLQCGTLGGGNHFIELCLDTSGRVWMMLHSGSRNIGKTLAEHHMNIAKKLVHNADLPDPDLAAFLSGTPEIEAYRNDLMWAQEYAMVNRLVMFAIYCDVMEKHFPNIMFEDPILCHHNYVSEETHFGEEVLVTRKGAIRASKGDLGIIPGSMGTKSYIVRGLGNPESFNSASHGAGRRLSRTKAKKQFTLSDLEAQTAGIECRKDEGVLDEIPGAYKDIDQVMQNQRDLVEVVAELRQVLCVKG